MNKNKVTFILHKPQLSENIGACARAIKNFNFQKLYLIDPKPIFPNDKILATSVGAKDIIKKSKVFKAFELCSFEIWFRPKNSLSGPLLEVSRIHRYYFSRT